jgi:2-polyprenyl-3-methyl-5-hydroxy-6-metoxy-1,4-benzoquinol methylase
LNFFGRGLTNGGVVREEQREVPSHVAGACTALSIYEKLKSLKSGTNDETNGRHIIPDLAFSLVNGTENPRILDVGAGHGVDISAIASNLTKAGMQPVMFAIETFPVAIEKLKTLGVSVHSIDIEREPLPFSNAYFDVVICNQVLEHTKEIFWIVSELARVTKKGGKLIIGVPNLGSLHNRIALLAGYQPPAISVFGTHVRGFTVPGLTKFLEMGSFLEVSAVIGGNFYPFPPSLSRKLSRAFPSLSVSSFYLVDRTLNDGSFLSIFDSNLATSLVDTPYFRGRSAND